MKTSYTLLLLLVATLSFAKTNADERKIILKADVQGIFYVTVVSTPNNEVRIKYMLHDSLSNSIRNDEFYKSRIELFRKGNLKLEEKVTLMEKIDSITQQYTYYTIDSITVNTEENPQYLQVFNTFFASSAEYHEKTNQIILDGISMVFTLSEGRSSRKIYGRSPNQDSNPLMYEFISQTMNMYRKQKPGGILSRDRTRGY